MKWGFKKVPSSQGNTGLFIPYNKKMGNAQACPSFFVILEFSLILLLALALLLLLLALLVLPLLFVAVLLLLLIHRQVFILIMKAHGSFLLSRFDVVLVFACDTPLCLAMLSENGEKRA